MLRFTFFCVKLFCPKNSGGVNFGQISCLHKPRSLGENLQNSHSKLISSGINRWFLSLVLFNPYLWNTCVGHVQKHCGRNSTLHTIEARLHAFFPPEDHDRAVSRWASSVVLVWKSNASTKKAKSGGRIINCELQVSLIVNSESVKKANCNNPCYLPITLVELIYIINHVNHVKKINK